MPRKIDREVLLGFVAEAHSYLPTVRQVIDAYSVETPAETIDEAYRLVHTIKGAASMVGLSSLSHVAYRLEMVLEDLSTGALPPSPQARPILSQMLVLVEAALDAADRGDPVERALLPEADRLDRRLRGLPEEMVEAPDPFVVDEPPAEPAPFSQSEPTSPPDLWPPIEAADEAPLPAPDAPSFIDEDLGSFPVEAMLGAEQNTFATQQPATDDAEPDEEAISPELLEVFQLEAETHLRTITATLPLLEQQPDNKTHLHEVRRSAHTLKGAAGMVGFRNVTRLAHRMEDALDLLHDGGLTLTPPMFQLLFASTDALEDMAAGQHVALDGLFAQYDELLGASAPEETTKPAIAAPVMTDEPADETVPAAARRPRVNESLDDLVKLVTEQVIARTVFEQRMADFQRLLNELRPSTERLRKVSYKMETQYEASALGDGLRNPQQQGRFPDRLLRALQPYGFDDLEFDRYNEFHLLSRDLAETTSDVQTLAVELGHLMGDFESYLTQQARLTAALEDKLMRLRMVPLATIASKLHRTVRQVALQQGKKAVLVLEGENTGLDKNVLEEMSEPLLHLLRNAVDHGIEPAELRQARGKKPHGEIRFRAAHEGSQVVLRLSDDGAGLDVEAIRLTAVQRGLVSSEDVARLSEREVFLFIFQAGFSTAQTVSEISGRGVGLDVVAARVNQLKGFISIESQPGKGTCFTIRLPLTLAITRALMVKAHQETFAVPLDDVRQILRVDRSEIEVVGSDSALRVAGRVYPVIHLAQALNLRQAADEAFPRPPVLLLNAGDRDVALVVDQLQGAREIVVKNLGSHLKRVRGVSGATLLGDGSVVLILNPPELVQERATSPIARAASHRARASASLNDSDLTILIVDDSPSVRRVVSGQIKHAGWKPVTAKNGLEALEILQHGECRPDLILLDVEMPRMDGYEFLSTMRANEAYRNLPVVMLTSRSGDKHRRKALELGVSDYLIKPYEDEVLLARIRQLVGKARKALV